MKTNHHISHFYNALLKYDPLHQAWCESYSSFQVQGKQINSHKVAYVQNVCHWYEHKQASVLATGELHHQLATAPSRATHTAETLPQLISVVNSGVILQYETRVHDSHTHVEKMRSKYVNSFHAKVIHPFFRHVKVIKIHQDLP